MKRGVKFCGGCRSEYDRSEALKILEERLGGKIEPANPEKIYDEIYVICGCSASCADVSALKAARLVYIERMPQ